MGKRGNGEGSITKRKDDRWEGTLTVGYTDKGNPRRVRVYGKTRAEVAEKLNKLLLDHQRGTLVLPKRLTVAEGKPVLSKPKTAKEQRRIFLLPEGLEVLKVHAKTQAAERVQMQTTGLWHDTGYLFTSSIGTPIDPNNLKRGFVTLADTAGVPVSASTTCATPTPHLPRSAASPRRYSPNVSDTRRWVLRWRCTSISMMSSTKPPR